MAQRQYSCLDGCLIWLLVVGIGLLILSVILLIDTLTV